MATSGRHGGPPAPDVEIRIAENGEVHVPLAGHVRRLLQGDEARPGNQ
jgi:hypothetical protein